MLNKAENYFEENENSTTNKIDPAYKFIKSKKKPSPNWKSELNDEEKEILHTLIFRLDLFYYY